MEQVRCSIFAMKLASFICRSPRQEAKLLFFLQENILSTVSSVLLSQFSNCQLILFKPHIKGPEHSVLNIY